MPLTGRTILTYLITTVRRVGETHYSKEISTHQLRSRLYSAMAPVERLTDKLETPALDDRSYRVIRLPNKLEALLVHDPETDKASASVNVNVGSFSDADDMPGMAHAVEHLLFMGTKKVSLPLRTRPKLEAKYGSIRKKTRITSI